MLQNTPVEQKNINVRKIDMLTATEILNLVNDSLEHLPYNRRPQSLYDPIKYVLSMGGKRIRPTLMLLSYNLFRDDPESILSSACAIETYHNYTLLHDDLMDNAVLRRGHQTVHERWDANTAILSGDSMLVLAYQRMAQCREDKYKPVQDLFTETALEIGEGQQYDMEFESRSDVTEDEYIEMIRLKTSVLLACALKMGALLADASATDADLLYKFGEQIGLAFQLQDDYLDVYGDTKVFGKAIGGDIVSNKKTYMLINAFQRADAADGQELKHWTELKDFDPQEKIAAVTRLYNKMGIDRLALAKIEHYFDESRKYLADVSVPDDRKRELSTYAERMMHRNY
jgi:geranylgeranyl diphosphate synthase type II